MAARLPRKPVSPRWTPRPDVVASRLLTLLLGCIVCYALVLAMFRFLPQQVNSTPVRIAVIAISFVFVPWLSTPAMRALVAKRNGRRRIKRESDTP